MRLTSRLNLNGTFAGIGFTCCCCCAGLLFSHSFLKKLFGCHFLVSNCFTLALTRTCIGFGALTANRQ